MILNNFWEVCTKAKWYNYFPIYFLTEVKLPYIMHFRKWSIRWVFLWFESLKNSGHKLLEGVLIGSYWCFPKRQMQQPQLPGLLTSLPWGSLDLENQVSPSTFIEYLEVWWAQDEGLGRRENRGWKDIHSFLDEVTVSFRSIQHYFLSELLWESSWLIAKYYY